MLSCLLASLLPAAGLVDACGDVEAGPAFKTPTEVKALLDAGNVSVLDARGGASPRIQGSLPVAWQSFAVGDYAEPDGGLIKPQPELIHQFAQLGISPLTNVIVCGSWDGGWGEEGRFHWMLTYLGHGGVFVLAGGVQPFLDAYPDAAEHGEPQPATPVPPSSWDAASVDSSARILKSDLLGDSRSPLLVDVREADEYTGAADHPFGVSRNGHAKGAVSLPFTELFDAGGCVLACGDLRRRLEAFGWAEGGLLAAYCTGGIRSGFFWTMALHCNLTDASNYDGSMWEYAADSAMPMATSPPTDSSQAGPQAWHLVAALLPLVAVAAEVLSAWSPAEPPTWRCGK